MIDIVQLSGDDWQAIYLNGVMADQGHSVNLYFVMRGLIQLGEGVASYENFDITQFGYDYSDANDFPQVLDLDEYRKGPR